MLKELLNEIKNEKEDKNQNEIESLSLPDLGTIWKEVDDDYTTILDEGILFLFSKCENSDCIKEILDKLLKEIPSDNRFNSLSDEDFKKLLENIEKLKENHKMLWENIIKPAIMKDKFKEGE